MNAVADLDFLSSLDKKLHVVKKSVFTPNMEGSSFDVLIDSYTGESMSEADIQRVFEAVERGGFALYPINTGMGFAVGFQVAGQGGNLLTFKEAQLPSGYDFSRLSDFFMRPENLKRANSMGVIVINDRGHYDY